MTKILRIPLDVTTESDREELFTIVAEAQGSSNKVVDALLEDQWEKLKDYNGDRNGK